MTWLYFFERRDGIFTELFCVGTSAAEATSFRRMKRAGDFSGEDYPDSLFFFDRIGQGYCR